MLSNLLAGDGREVFEKFLSEGMEINSKKLARQKLLEYISLLSPQRKLILVSKLGWYKNHFVLPNQIYPQNNELILRTDIGTSKQFETSGSLSDWQNNIAKYAKNNSRLILALSCAFAAPLLHLANEESGAIHLVGNSSLGKTTALQVASSVWGSSHFIKQWRMTCNALEVVAQNHSDCLLPLDELAQADSKAVSDMIYMLANNEGKRRLRSEIVLRNQHNWRTLILSTGEIDIATKVAEVSKKAFAGMEVRFVSLPANCNTGHGIFEDLHGFKNGDQLFRHLKDGASKYYGSPIQKYLELLTNDIEDVTAKIKQIQQEFKVKYIPEGSSGQVMRVASRFGLIAAAGELAIRFGILPLAVGDTTEAVAKCEDGKFRSIAFDEILKNNKFFGQVFRNELALETKNLGYEITPTILSDGSSSFELSKIDQKLIDAFSTRRKEIEELCKLFNVTTKSGRDNIVINSRKSKNLGHQEDIVKAWHKLEQVVQKEITQANLLNEKSEEKTYNQPSVSLHLEDLVKLCIEDITQHKSVFTKEELPKKVLKLSMGNHNIREIDNELKAQESQGMLIKYDNQYTSKIILTQEKYILKHAQNAIGKSKPLVEEKYFAAHYEKFTKRELTINPEFQMNKQQQLVAKHILASKDNIITVVGLPGVGKSTVLDSVRNIADHKVNKIIRLFIKQENFEGMAPTASAAKTLGGAAKIESNTIHHFIGKYQGYLEGRGSNESLQGLSKNYKNTIIFVDEASLISTNVMHKLTTLQSMLKFKMVLVGDTKQLAAVEAGKPFEQILSVIKPIELKQIVRQKDQSHKQAIIAAT